MDEITEHIEVSREIVIKRIAKNMPTHEIRRLWISEFSKLMSGYSLVEQVERIESLELELNRITRRFKLNLV